MAMNKIEKAQMQALKVKASFYRTQPVEPDVLPPKSGTTTGYRALHPSYSAPIVESMWSTSVTHGRGVPGDKRLSGSQNARALFSTPELALRALRYQVEIESMERLAAIDAAIEQAGPAAPSGVEASGS